MSDDLPTSGHGHFTIDVTGTVRMVIPRTGIVATDAQAIYDGIDTLLLLKRWADAPDATAEAKAVYRTVFPERGQAARGGGPGHQAAPLPGAGGQRGGERHTGLFCPRHEGIELIPSAAKYQPRDNGEIVWDKFFCPADRNPEGRNHTIWRSQAVGEQ